VELYLHRKASTLAGVDTKPRSVRVSQGRFLHPPAPRAFPLSQGPHQVREMTIPGASTFLHSAGPESLDKQVYPTSKGISTRRRALSKGDPRVLYVTRRPANLQLTYTAWS